MTKCAIYKPTKLDIRTHPALLIELLTLAGQALSERLRRANAEIRALSQ